MIMKINPMLKKEIMVNVRGIRLTVMMLVFNLVLAIIGLVVFYYILETARWSGSIDYSSTIMLYTVLMVIQFLLLAFMVPALTAGAISGERERQTLDILLASTLTPGKIVFGKLSSSILSVILMIISSIPIMSLIFIFGGIEIWDLFANVIFLIYIALFAGSIGIYCSARFKKTTGATAAAYGFVLFLGFGTVILTILLAFIYSFTGNGGKDVIKWIVMLILLFNPGATLVEIIGAQLGEGSLMENLFYESGLLGFIAEHWIFFSILFQCIIMVIMMRGAVKRVNPLYQKRSRKKG